MKRTAEIRNAWILMRPGQWPILATQFLVATMLVSPAALQGGCWLNPASLLVLTVAAGAWVVLLNGGTLAFNSAFDKDTTPIAYLPDPPPPPAWLAGAATVVMLMGALLGALVVGSGFGLTVLFCVALSLLYSHPLTRLKSRPGMDLAVNMLGYGAATTLAGVLAGTAAHAGACGRDQWRLPSVPASTGTAVEQWQAAVSGEIGWIILAFGLLFGSFYPLTQIYQMEDDRARGDRTLATGLGLRPALWLALGLGVLAAGALWQGLSRHGHGPADITMGLAMLLWLIHLVRWLGTAEALDKETHERHMYTALALWAVVDVALVISWIF